jgi:hypothetical protein
VGRHLHFDCFSGISGDMVLGALVDAGLPLSQLVTGLKRLKVGTYRLEKRRVRRGALHATKVNVFVNQGFAHPLTLSRIQRTIASSTLPEIVKQQSRVVFDRLAEAEGLAHRVAKHHVHFHEVGIVDSLVDVVGSLLGCHLLGVTQVTSSAVNVGAGTIRTSHGLLPVPGPAIAALAKGIPIYGEGPRCELATPTGVALLRTLTSEFGSMPLVKPARTGYGAGDANPEGWPNVLRVFLSDDLVRTARSTDRVVQIDTNLDDLTPQAYDYVMERLFAAGALDVTLTPVIMKKSRPGVILSCLVAHEHFNAAIDVLFQETTALGVRFQSLVRQVLPRRFVTVKVRGGIVHVKVADLGNGQEKAAPEYVDCKRIADRTGRPVKDVMQEAAVAYRHAELKSKKEKVTK